MCQVYTNELMEPTDDKLIGPNSEEIVGSATLLAGSSEVGNGVQDGFDSHEVPLTSQTALTSLDSFASNYSDFSVDVNLHDGRNLEEGGSESGLADTGYLLHNGHLSESSLIPSANGHEQSDDQKENHKDGMSELLPGNQDLKGTTSSSDGDNESLISNESSDEESDTTPTFDDKDEIWEPPEAENEDDDKEHNMATLVDDDDECADGDGTQWPKAMEEDEVSSDFHCKKEKQEALEEVMNGKFKKLVSRLLKKAGVDHNDCEKRSWIEIVAMLAWRAALFVKPDSTKGKAMDPAGYVKVKCIATGSPTESRLIKGLVFKKHAAHKHMVTNYKNPRLLLIQGMLGHGSSGWSSFSSMLDEGKDNLANLIENLEACHPNVILVEKSASRDVLEKVLDLGFTLVVDMKLNRLERVARCTGSPILSSDSSFSEKLKHCESLYFEKFVEDLAIVGEGGKKPSKTLMFVEGCPTRLGCTILLKGSHSEELKKIKSVLQCAVVMAYHFILETSFLVDQKAMYSTVAFHGETDILPTDELSTTVVSEASDIPQGEDLSVAASADESRVSISRVSDDSTLHVQDSVVEADSSHDHDIPISSEFSEEQLNHIKQSSEEIVATSNGFHNEFPQKIDFIEKLSTVSDELQVETVSRASPVATDVQEKESTVPPETDQELSVFVDLNGRVPDTETLSSVSHTEEAPDEHNMEARGSSLVDKPPLGHLRSLSNVSDPAADETKPATDGEDFIRPMDEISSILDSESILVLMSSRNALRGTICEQSRLIHIKFYRNFDVSLGKYLRDNLFNQSLPCKACGGPPEAHFYYYAHQNKQLTIRVKRLGDQNHLPGQAEGKLWMWSRCGKCEPGKEKATKRVLISTAARGLSFGNFLELSFSSHSSFNRLSSCGHSFQKDFLYFFGLGSMVAMFQYSRVATYQVSVPAQKLDFNNSIEGEWLRQEIESVYTKGLLLFTELSNYLKKIESQFATLNLALNGSSKGFADIQAMLKVERAEFEENFKSTGIKNENANNSGHKLLSLNRIRWELLLEACVWDRRLQFLSISNGVLRGKINSKEIGDPGGDAEGSQTPIEKVAGNMVSDDQVSGRGMEEILEAPDELQGQMGSHDDHHERTAPVDKIMESEAGLEGHEAQVGATAADVGHHEAINENETINEADKINEAHNIVARDDHNTSEHFTDSDFQIERVAEENQSSEELSSERLVQATEEQDSGEQNLISLPIEEHTGQMPGPKDTNDVLLEEHLENSNLKSGLHSRKDSLQIDEMFSSDNVMENKAIPVIAGQESAGKETVAAHFLNAEDPRGWVWHLFAEIREECMKDFHKGCLPKFGHLPKFELQRSPDFLPTVSQVIMEEGSRLHIPLCAGDYIVSDYDGEISSSIACALALMKDSTPPVSDGDNNATLKRTASEPSPNWSGNDDDRDTIRSAPSMPHPDNGFPSFEGLNNLNSLHAHGQLHREMTLGVEKYPPKGKYSVVIMHASRFRALRDRCCPSEVDYISSLCRCKIWDAKGGKSNSFFAKTLDERLIIKEIKRTEFESFMKFAAEYFRHMNDSFETGNQTCLAKILGIYQITIRHPKSGKETKHDLMVQENLSFGRNINRQYDLKGALHARFTTTADGTGDVLLDQNFVNDMNSSPLYVGQKSKRLLQRAVWNDTTFLTSINVMDYSLLVSVDRQRHELVCGIIDYLRQYTWDKQFETWVKSSLVVPKNVLPTIISPKEYKKRFRKFMDTHFLTVPDHWCSHRPSNPCKLCGIKVDDSLPVKLEKREGEQNGSNAHLESLG